MKLKLRKGWLCTKCGKAWLSWFKSVRCHSSPVKWIYVTVDENKVVRPVLKKQIQGMTDREAEDETFGLITDLTEGV